MAGHTLCVATDPGRAQCRIEAARVERDPIACLEMIEPTLDLLDQVAADIGMTVIYLDASCERGPMG